MKTISPILGDLLERIVREAFNGKGDTITY